MKRREFISLVGGAAVAWPLAARAQQSKMPVIGFLGSESPELWADRLRAFRQGLSETGYVERQNVTIEYRWAEGHNDRLPPLAADLVRRQVAVIATISGYPAALAAKAATLTIPIIFQLANDPVATGLVASLSRPSGNLTGITSLNSELGPKRLELLHELVPTATNIALLVNPSNPSAVTGSKDLQGAAHKIGLQLHVLNASTESDFDTAFATMIKLRVGGLVIVTDLFFTSRSKQLAALTVRHAIPTIYQNREFAVAGGLVSYGGSIPDAIRRAGVYTGRILKGEKVANLPVQQSAKIEMILNLKTAKTFGIDVSLPLLGRADEVIE